MQRSHSEKSWTFSQGPTPNDPCGRERDRAAAVVGGTRPSFQDEELVSGIADFQVELGVDDPADPDDAVDRWIRPGEPMNGAMLRALRIELEAVSDIPERDQRGLARRKRVSRVVELRNPGTPS